MLYSCSKGKGTVSGNVFWKYNKFVGDKPDAGAEVYLFSTDSTIDPLKAETDVAGNYKFEDVPVNRYLLVIQSKNTTTNGYDQLYEFFMNSVQNYFKADINSTEAKKALDYNHEIEIAKIKAIQDDQYADSVMYYNSVTEKLSDSLLNDLEKRSSIISKYFKLGRMSKKLKIYEIPIKNGETVTKVTDFGITYY